MRHTDLVQMFLRNGGGSNNLAKAITSASVPGVTPEFLSKYITSFNFLRDPLAEMWNVKRIAAYRYPLRDWGPGPLPGSAIGEGGTTPQSDQTITPERYVYPGIYSRKFTITEWVKAVTERHGSDEQSGRFDLEGAIIEKQLGWFSQDLVMERYWGQRDTVLPSYSCDGLTRYCRVNTRNRFNRGTLGNPDLPTSFEFLDEAIENATMYNSASPDRQPTDDLTILMSPRMLTYMAQQDDVKDRLRIQRELTPLFGLAGITLPAGTYLASFMGIPIVPTMILGGGPFLPQMGVVTPSTSAGTGVLANGTYYIQVSAVGYGTDEEPWFGEITASTEVAIPLVAGPPQKISLSWPDQPNALYYRIYASLGTTGGAKLIDVIPARTFDGAGTPTGRVTTHDILSMTPTAAAQGMEQDQPMNAVGGFAGENIMLVDTGEYKMGNLFVVFPAGNQMGGDIRFGKLAETDLLYGQLQMISSQCPIPYFTRSTTLVRGVRPGGGTV